MGKFSLVEFKESPSEYLVCMDQESKSDISCVIVEDDPGPYLEFVQDILQSGFCSLAMTAPFTDATLRLLSGEEVELGDGASVRLQNLQHTVVIMDMRNETEQEFAGYDKDRLALCGYQFFQHMPGFPGKVFFATRYGRELLEKEGLTGAFGVVQLQMKSGFDGPMPEPDQQKLKAALGHALVQCNTSKIFSVVRRGDFIDITFGGEVCSLRTGKDGAKKSGLAFREVIKAGEDGISDEDLAKAINYHPVTAKKTNDINDVPDSAGSGPSAEEFLPKLLEVVQEGKVPGVSFDDLKSRLGIDDFHGAESAEEVFREVYEMSQHVDPDFSLADLAEALRGGPAAGADTQLDKAALNDSFSVSGSLDDNASISARDKAVHLQRYVVLNFSEIPKREAEMSEMIAEKHMAQAASLRKAAAAADDDRIEDAKESKQLMKQEAEECESRIAELEGKIKQLRALRDESYRIMKCTFRDGAYRPLAVQSKIQDFMSRQPKRLAQDLQRDCDPVPESLVAHIQQYWTRQSGIHRYTGKADWRIV